MKKLEFDIDINADVKEVWDTMLSEDSFKEMMKGAHPGSYYEGEWKKGTDIKFLTPGGGGTKANLVDVVPNKYVLAKHVAVINADGSEDTNSKQAQGWVGTTESYSFSGDKGKSHLKIEVNTTPEWAAMFTDAWPKLLKKLKSICEN